MCFKRPFGSIIPWALALSMVAALMGASAVSGAVPGNDDRASATVVRELPFRDRLDTSDATRQASDPDCAAEGNNHSVWYSFTPRNTGYYLARTAKPEFWATLTLAKVRPDGSLRILQCWDWGWNQVLWRAKAGYTYLFMVGAAYGEPGGRVVFRLMKAPTPPTISVALTKRPWLTDEGGVRLRGVVSCTGVDHADVFATARQYWRRFTIRADWQKMVRCGSTWRMTLRNELIKFGRGRVKIKVRAGTCNVAGCASDTIVRRVTLR